MSALLLLAAACLGMSAELIVSPDQPLQFSYLDEPLVIAIAPDADAEVQARATIRPPRGEAQETDLGTLALRAGQETWLAVPALPPGEGYFAIEVTLTQGEETIPLRGGFARIRRNVGEHSLPVFAYGEEANPQALRALRSAPVPALRIDLLHPEAHERAAALRKQGFKLTPYLDARNTPNPAEVARAAAEAWCDSVLRWDVAAGSSVALIEDVAEAVRSTSCSAPVVAVVENTETFKALIEQGLGGVVRSVVVELKEDGEWTVASVQRIAEQAGFEQWDVYAVLPPPEKGAEEQQYLTKRIFTAMAEGFRGVGFHAREIYDGGLTAAFSRLNALSYQLGSLEFAGELPLVRGVESLLFKHGGDWFLVLWSTNGKAVEVLLEVGDAGKLKAVDQFNQTMELPDTSKGVLPLTVETSPVYITGRGGSLFDRAARPLAKRIASDLMKRPEILEVLGPEVSTAVNSVVLGEGAITQRPNFFAMVRAFPDLERRWHAGELPRHLAVSAISHLAKLVRQLCVVEQQRGEAFLEPLQDTLARCEEYQTYYLTSSRGSDNQFERGDWLLGEVRRLMNEANDLAAAGRRIEASAVAALAEWRARGLDFAAGAGERPLEDEVTVTLALPDKPPPVADAASDGPDMPVEGIHKIVRGDTLGGIARKYGVPLKELMANNNLTAKSRLQIGQEIKVAGGTVAPFVAEPEPVEEEKPEQAPEPEEAPKQEEDEEVAEAAPPEPEPAAEPGEGKKITHTVQRNETTHSIARKYGISEAEFRQWNSIRAGATLARGKEYVVYVPQRAEKKKPEPQGDTKTTSGADAPQGTKQVEHTVRKGENPYLIAKKYNVPLEDFLKWNKMTKRSRMQVGDKCIVFVKK